MGKIESNRTSIFSQIHSEIQCPLCGKQFSEKTSFIELNFHLYYCDKEKKIISKSNNCLNNDIQNESREIMPYKYNSETKRTKEIKENDLNIDNITGNEFQLVIDYNENEDIYEEELKNKRKNSDEKEIYIELRNFLNKKKSQMNYNMTIECNSFSQIYKTLKEINIYYDIKIIYDKKNNEKRIYSLDYILNKYIKTMIKLNIFEIKNEENILSFSFDNKKIDFEMIGIIFAILIIYPEIKLKNKFPLIIFKMLINQRITLNDIKYENKQLYHNLFELSKYKDIPQLNLNYTYEGNELILGGTNIKISSINVYDYIEKVVNYEMNKYTKKINIIKNIIFQFIPKKYIFSFNAEQIEQIINKNL